MKEKLEAIVDRLVVEALMDSQFAIWGPEQVKLLKRQLERAFDLGATQGYGDAMEEQYMEARVQ